MITLDSFNIFIITLAFLSGLGIVYVIFYFILRDKIKLNDDCYKSNYKFNKIRIKQYSKNTNINIRIYL